MATYSRKIDARAFTLQGGNFVTTVARTPGEYWVISPEVVNSLGGTPNSAIAAPTLQNSALRQSGFDPLRPASDFENSNWVAKNWSDPVENSAAFQSELENWAALNLNSSTLNPGARNYNLYWAQPTGYTIPVLFIGDEGAPAVDADAQAFLTAAGISDATQIGAINQLVTDLKGSSIWSKMSVIYPFVGGTASTHKWNLKDPRDLDAAYRLTFVGTWTHTSNGAIGSSGAVGIENNYANTYLAPSTVFSSIQNGHISYYSRSSGGQQGYDMGAGGLSGTQFNMYIQFTNNNSYASVNGDAAASTGSNGLGLFTVTSTPSFRRIYRNTTFGTAAAASGSLPTQSIFIGGSNGSGDFRINRICAWASIGQGLNDAEVTDLYNSVRKFQTTLGRQV